MFLRFSLLIVLFGICWCQDISRRVTLCNWKRSGAYPLTNFQVEEIGFPDDGAFWKGWFSINSTQRINKEDIQVQFKEPAKISIKKWSTVYSAYDTGNYEHKYFIHAVSENKQNLPVISKVILKGLEICNTDERTCGKRILHHQQLITSGYLTRPGDWPWHAAIFHATKRSISYKCGGSVISNTAILTAAHCVKDNDKTIIPEKIQVKLGLYDKLIADRNTQDFRAYRIMPHPHFSASNLQNDIAVIKLSAEIIYTSYVQPVCLWPNDLIDIRNLEDQTGYVTGWGINENDDLVDILNEARMPVVSHSKCLDSNRDFFASYVSSSNFCAGFRNGTSVCTGDSGGGLVFEQNNTYSIRGIVSLSKAGLESKCDTKEYVIFTDVAQYLDWIQNHLTN